MGLNVLCFKQWLCVIIVKIIHKETHSQDFALFGVSWCKKKLQHKCRVHLNDASLGARSLQPATKAMLYSVFVSLRDYL